jgi:hypothetical protein
MLVVIIVSNYKRFGTVETEEKELETETIVVKERKISNVIIPTSMVLLSVALVYYRQIYSKMRLCMYFRLLGNWASRQAKRMNFIHGNSPGRDLLYGRYNSAFAGNTFFV